MRFLASTFATRTERFTASLAIVSGIIGMAFILSKAAEIARLT